MAMDAAEAGIGMGAARAVMAANARKHGNLEKRANQKNHGNHAHRERKSATTSPDNAVNVARGLSANNVHRVSRELNNQPNPLNLQRPIRPAIHPWLKRVEMQHLRVNAAAVEAAGVEAIAIGARMARVP